jgi:hypothetical protein
MYMSLTLSRSLLVISCVTLASVLGFSDTIKLKNGSVIKGKVTTYNDREFTVFLDLGSSTKRTSSRMVISVDDIESIQFDSVEPGSGPPAQTNVSQSVEGSERPSVREPVAREVAPPPTPTPNKAPAVAEAPLAEKTVPVIAAADWTSTEIKVKKGQRVSISASGQVDLGSNRRSGPEGISITDPKKLILNSPTGALIAVIGDDNDDFIFIGPQADFVAERDGTLFLSVNEANLRDNNGSFSARVRVFGK